MVHTLMTIIYMISAFFCATGMFIGSFDLIAMSIALLASGLFYCSTVSFVPIYLTALGSSLASFAFPIGAYLTCAIGVLLVMSAPIYIGYLIHRGNDASKRLREALQVHVDHINELNRLAALADKKGN